MTSTKLAVDPTSRTQRAMQQIKLLLLVWYLARVPSKASKCRPQTPPWTLVLAPDPCETAALCTDVQTTEAGSTTNIELAVSPTLRTWVRSSVWVDRLRSTVRNLPSCLGGGHPRHSWEPATHTHTCYAQTQLKSTS
jgi:hypothetical protein